MNAKASLLLRQHQRQRQRPFILRSLQGHRRPSSSSSSLSFLSSSFKIKASPQNQKQFLLQAFVGKTSLSCYSTTKTTTSSPQVQILNRRDGGLDLTGQATYPHEIEGPNGLPSRSEQVKRLSNSSPESPYDVLVIGGGATGCGIALDAATREGSLKVACIERGDFASETSSRSTKLIWAGIRYLATASVSLLSNKLVTNPINTVKDFWGEIRMVLNCHRERRYMVEKQPHLTNWVPIAIPFTEWHVTPPPFDHKLFSFFPILAPFVLKLYDAMSSFTCPPSYILTKRKAKEIFPQLSGKNIKYCAVFYEAQHNDSRTNIAIAMSAAEHGAHISNYIEMIDTIRNERGLVVGVKAWDRMSLTEFHIHAKKVVFAGGPFTDSMREMESSFNSSTSSSSSSSSSTTTTTTTSKSQDQAPMKRAVAGASGTHIVLPGYYCPPNIGLLDYNTSDGRFLFFLPWEKHTLVGTTDTKCPAETLPTPPEDEVQWILNECEKYLSKDLQVRRSDVLSAWRGWRPLAVDPHAPPGAPISRDHIISENPDTGVLFVAGGKWTTWREMSEEVVDKIVGESGPTCKTMDISLFGRDGYSSNLAIQLIQKHGMSNDTANSLAKTYGGRAWEVCDLSSPTGVQWPRFGIPLAPNYPYIDADVRYACREYACTIEDILSRRTRLAFLNKDAALAAIPFVADIMTEELGWSQDVKLEQIIAAQKYIESYGGRIPDKRESTLRDATFKDIETLFEAIDTDGSGFLDRHEVGELATVLGFPLNEKELNDAFERMDYDKSGRVSLREFEAWWNHEHDNELRNKLCEELSLGGIENVKKVGTGTFLG